MNLKISTIIKSIIGILLFIFSIFCFLLNYYISIPIGIISLFSSILISPLFEIFCRKINKKFTIFQKLTLFYGMIILIFTSTMIIELNILSVFNIPSTGIDESYKIIMYIIYTLLILLYFGLFVLFNKRKYKDKVNVSIRKRIILIIITILLMNLPIIIIKVVALSNYYNNVYEIFDYNVLEEINISSLNTNDNIESFNKLKYKFDYHDYVLVNEDEFKKEYKKEGNSSYIRISTDLINPVYKNINFNDTWEKQWYKIYDISSVGKFYEHFNKYKKLSILDNLYNIVLTNLHSVIALGSCDSYQKINVDNGLSVYIIILNQEKGYYELIVDNKEFAYSIMIVDTDGEITKNHIMEFIKTLSIEE